MGTDTLPESMVFVSFFGCRQEERGPPSPPRYGVHGPIYWNPRRVPHGRNPWRYPHYRPRLATYSSRPPRGRYRGRYLDTLRRRAYNEWCDRLRAIVERED